MYSGGYVFEGGFPTEETIQRVYDDTDLTRAIEVYKFFYPSVSMAAIWKGNMRAGAAVNAVFLQLDGSPRQVVLTPNSDTPYAGLPIDLSAGPVVVELAPGPLMAVVNDLNQRYVMDLGLPGPDAGKGGKHLIVPPGYTGRIPPGYHTGTASTNRVLLMLRALPLRGDTRSAVALLKSVKVHPLDAGTLWADPQWIEMPDRLEYFTPFPWEQNLEYWRELHELVDAEPAFEPFHMYYGALASLGIAKGKPFAPDLRMKAILDHAAKVANAHLRVRAFADRRPDRVAWRDRSWEWVSLRPESGTFDLAGHRDLEAREKWFYQAAIESPAMFRRDVGAGSLYWLAARDADGAFLDGARHYTLTVPLPVPAKLFWSVTVYDPFTRSELQTDQGHAALRSLFELQDLRGSSVELHFGPRAPGGDAQHWIRTQPDKGWFAYFRIYGPEAAAFDGSWRPGDFERVVR